MLYEGELMISENGSIGVESTIEKLKKFAEKRIDFIDKLDLGQVTKEEFIEKNYDYIQTLNLGRLSYDVNSAEEGIFKYYYWNIIAKKNMLLANEYEYKNPSKSRRYKEDAFDSYSKKDIIILNMLECLKYKDVEGYFIEMDSKALNGTIYEINLSKLDKVILHSKSKKVLNKLINNGVFNEKVQKSQIDNYINTKVY